MSKIKYDDRVASLFKKLDQSMLETEKELLEAFLEPPISWDVEKPAGAEASLPNIHYRSFPRPWIHLPQDFNLIEPSGFPPPGYTLFAPPYLSGSPEKTAFSPQNAETADGQLMVGYSNTFPQSGQLELSGLIWSNDPEAQIAGTDDPIVGPFLGDWKFRQVVASLDLLVYTVPLIPNAKILDLFVPVRIFANSLIEQGASPFQDEQIARATMRARITAQSDSGFHLFDAPSAWPSRREYSREGDSLGVLQNNQYAELSLSIEVVPFEAVAVRVLVLLFLGLRNDADFLASMNASHFVNRKQGTGTILVPYLLARLRLPNE